VQEGLARWDAEEAALGEDLGDYFQVLSESG
jgi:hypothetical protein